MSTAKLAASSVAKQFRRVFLPTTLVGIASLSVWAQIGVAPASITFTVKQVVGTTSASKAVTISNSGVSAQPIVIVMSGDYTESDNCGGSVAAGGSCTASISFVPTLVGSVSGAASLYDNSSDLLAFVGLKGTGEAPVTAAPASLAFAGGTIGTLSAAKTFKITNNTATSITINSITTNVSDYTISTGTCLTVAIAPKKYCTVSVQVTPTSATDDGAVVITDSAANAVPQVVKLTSSATGGSSTPISLSKTSLTFKVVTGGTSATQTITVTNSSASAVTLGAITASSDYAIVNNTCTGSLAASQTCTFGITFNPVFVGSVTGSAAVAYTGNNSPQLVNLTGTSEAYLTVAPASLTFTSQAIGTTSTAKSLKITNNYTSAITLSSVMPSGDFKIQPGGTSCPLTGGSLGAAKNCTIEVQFAPTIAGSVVGALTVNNAGSPNPLLVALSGTGTGSSTSASLNPSSAHQGSSETIVITGSNTNFGPTTTVSFGADITSGALTVNGPTSASVPIMIDDVAATGSRTVTITTGSQVVSAAFNVLTGVPQITLINPNTIGTSATESVSVTGAFTNWVSGTTKANFGPGISVGGAAAGTFGPVTVNSVSGLTANLVTSGAATSSNTVQIQTGSQTVSVANGMFVQNCTTNAPTVLLFSPAESTSNLPLNTQVSMQFSVPMNRSTFSLGSSGSIFFYDTDTSEQVPATISVDASGTIATITPSGLLGAGHRFYVYLDYASYIQDTCGNDLGGQVVYFNTAFGPDITGPALTGTSPVSGDTNIPLNVQINLQFSTQLDPITAQAGFSLRSGGNAVPGTFSYSTNDEIVTFTPVNPLAASTNYTVNYSAQITDTTGNPLSNPGSFSFTTGTASVTTGPSTLLVDPPNDATNVGLNVAPHLTFSEPVNQLTIPGNLSLEYYDNSGAVLTVPATLTVAANRLSATLTPSSTLPPNTLYYFYLNGNETDIAGNYGGYSNTYFYTGASSDTTPTTVSSISPTNGQTAVPTNTQVVVVMAAQIDPTSITNSAITVKQGTTSVAGTVTLASDNVTLTFAPTAALTASEAYSVSVGGFKDFEGNTVTTFTSSFSTGTAGYASGSFTLVSTSPVSGATGVAVTSPVTFTMSNLIDPASVNPNSVEVYTPNSELLAGTYAVNGASVTFTPLTPYPGNTTISMYVYGLADEAGNVANTGAGSFTTANTLDKTPPTVTISPANGATGVGLNTQVILTLSKSINTSTINTNTLALFSGETSIRYSYSVSLDNRTIVVTPATYYSAWTSGATISVALSGGIQDLSGNALAPVSSQFTLTTALPGAAPQVLSMLPSSGSNVPTNTVITLFTSAPMNVSSIAGSLFVTDKGVVVSGSVQTFSNGQAIEFTPSAPFGAGDLIQVFLNSTATSADGVPLSAFEGQFYVAGSPANTTATVEAVNPFPSATNVPLNAVIQVEYNQPLLASTVNNSNITLYQYGTGTYLTPTVTLVGTQVINIATTSPLVSGSQYQVYVSPNSAVTNVDGLTVQPYAFNFTAGTAADTVGPTIVSEAPTNNATNIGTNSAITVSFNKAINPISVTGSTIQVAAGSTIEVLSSISFSPDTTRVSIVPEAPLPPSTVITVTINGVTSEAGVAVAKTTTTFTTSAQPDVTAPYVINSTVVYGQTNVPVNSAFSMQFSKPMDVGSLDVGSVYIYSSFTGQSAPATISWSADQTTFFVVPTTPLAVGRNYYLASNGLTDLDGNLQTGFSVYFTTAFVANTNPPAVINTSPENTLTAVPTNSPVEILFTEPIQPTSISRITLTTGGNPVALSPTLSDANQLLTLIPVQPLLAPNASYTLTITGVKDTAGNVMTSTVTNTFTTGPTFDLSNASVISADPPSGAINIGINVTPRVTFSKRINPLSVVTSSNEPFNNGSVVLYNLTTGQFVPATVSMASNRTMATLTPSAPLTPNTSYAFEVSYQEYCYDVAGNYSNDYYGTFVTSTGSDTVHATVSTISPVNTQTGVPLNPQVIAVISDTVDPTTITSNSITLTPQGGSAIAGTVTLASDGVTLTYVPSVVLNASTIYNVSVGGFNDAQSNPVTPFASSFTTGTTGFGSGSFTLVSTTPANGATGISVTSPVTFTMTNLIDPASVNPNSLEVYEYNTNVIVAGTYAVNGASVTFTPLTQYPANTLMGMYVYGLTDEAGNTSYAGAGTFTTATTVDHTAPTVSITPANGTANAGLNTQVVLKFSKSINPATITQSSVNLLNGDVPLNPSTSISLDNRTVILNYNNATLPAGATLTVTASSLITDLSGNALANTISQFTTTPGISNAAPSVISMLPGNGASLVPANTVITLFTTTSMNAGTIPGALHISQNGVIISGTANVGSNGQSVEFTPGSALTAGATIQVFLDSTAQDVYGNFLTYYSGQFTVAGSPTNTTATVEAVNPFPSATNVPLNTVIQVEYDQPLLAGTVNNSNITLYQYSTGTYLTPTVTLVGTQVINIATTSPLVSGSQYQVYVSPNSAVTNVDGLTVQPYAFNFTAGTATDTVAPTIVYLAPPNAAVNIGTHAAVSVSFNKSINPVSVTGTAIQLTGGSVTEVPSSISFTPDYTRTMIVPQAPLPSSTTMTITISGVTSQAGVAVVSQNTTFTTQAGADFNVPYVVNSSVSTGQTVGTNAIFAMQFNKPMDPGSATGENAGNVYIYDNTAGVYVAFTASFSADLTTIFLKPTANLAASHEVSMYSANVTDLSGNPAQGFGVTFFTGTGTETTGPAVKQVSPPSGLTGVGINAPVQILFSEPIDAASLAGVTLKQGGTVVPISMSEFDGDQGVQLLPLLPLATSTTYTINVTGVLDITGNAQTSFPSQSFTTGPGTDLVPPTFVSSNPANGATNVSDSTMIQVVFSEPMDPASFDPNTSFQLQDPSSNVVPGVITFSSNYTTATFTPKATLLSEAQYYMYVGWPYISGYLYDVGGNRLYGTYFVFTTH